MPHFSKTGYVTSVGYYNEHGGRDGRVVGRVFVGWVGGVNIREE